MSTMEPQIARAAIKILSKAHLNTLLSNLSRNNFKSAE